MKCPVCQETLLMTDRQGVEIDYCPTCRGVWLDRGELEKLIERSSQANRWEPDPRDRRTRDDDDDARDRHGQWRYPEKHSRRESWLSRILDFD